MLELLHRFSFEGVVHFLHTYRISYAYSTDRTSLTDAGPRAR